MLVGVHNVLTPISQVTTPSRRGDIYLKASDMASFVAAHARDGEYQGERILSSASTAELRRQQFDGRTYGLGVGMAGFAGHDLIHHTGGIPGFSSTMVAEPATLQGVYIMANCNTPVLRELARQPCGSCGATTRSRWRTRHHEPG